MKTTVGISCYKQKKWLHRCLRSLTSQTIPKDEFEVIVVNDDPEEDLNDIFENYENIFPATDNNKFNKNIILLSLREITNMSTKEIRASMKKYKKIYLGLMFPNEE